MALPYTFGTATTPNTGWLDSNFNALGAISPIPGSAAGTNTIAFTAATNTPTVAAYNQNQTYVTIAAGTNTGAATAAVGSLAALPIYNDSAGGPVALTGGEIVIGNLILLTYDVALNGGGGGFHLGTGPAVLAGLYLPLTGGTLSGGLVAPTVSITGTGLNLQGSPSLSSLSAIGNISAANIAASGNVSTATLTATGIAAAHLTIPAATGSSITRILSSYVSLTWGSLGPGQTSLAAVTIAGLSIGDIVALGYPAALQAGIGYLPNVSSASVVNVTAFNFTPASSLTPTAGFYRATAMGFI